MIKHTLNLFIFTIICFVIFTFFIDVAKAADPYLNGFICPTFPSEGKKLAIFRITDSDRTDGDYNPQSGPFFCVQVDNGATEATWAQLLDGKYQNGTSVIKREWDFHDVEEEWVRKCIGIGEWVSNKGDQKPSSVGYELNTHVFVNCTVGPGYDVRQRYYFNDLGDPVDDMYLYFIKIASTTEHQENPIPKCAQKNNTDKDTCETWNNNTCYWFAADNKCKARADSNIKCAELNSEQCLLAYHCRPEENNTCKDRNVQIDQAKAVDQYISDRYKKPAGYTGPLPDCAFTGSCRSIEDLIGLGVKVADWIFGIIAGLGLVFFVYGGFTMVLSFGNAEKVGHGKQILVAAVIGMVIAFSAYILVSFIVKAIGILPGYSIF